MYYFKSFHLRQEEICNLMVFDEFEISDMLFVTTISMKTVK